MNNFSDSARLRRFIYVVLIVVAVGGVSGRILGVGRVVEPWLTKPANADSEDHRGPWPLKRPEPMPSHADNDRSRWATVRALVDNGEYSIGYREEGHDADGRPNDRGIIARDPGRDTGWGTIDKVLDPKTKRFYSSKPPLLPTMVAGEYWLLKHTLGWEITGEPGRWEVVRTILLTINALPWAIFLGLLALIAEKYGTTDWGRLFVMTAACFGTFLTPFATTLNNHTVAACCAMFALYPALRIWSWTKETEPSGKADPPLYLFLLAGFFGSFTACMELPAASFTAILFLLLLWRAPSRTLVAFVPMAVLPVAAFFLTNYLAIGQWKPAYGEFGGPWYGFEGSHFLEVKNHPSGIDGAGYLEEPRPVYAFHLLLGHHGLFSLTPIFLAAFVGMIVGLRFLVLKESPVPAPNQEQRSLGLASLLTLVVSLIVLGFYIFYLDKGSRNYGGWTCGPRWLLWLTPLWLITLLPAADWLGGRRWGRVLAYVFLAVSVVSVSYPAYSPWRHPWLYNWLEAMGWIKY